MFVQPAVQADRRRALLIRGTILFVLGLTAGGVFYIGSRQTPPAATEAVGAVPAPVGPLSENDSRPTPQQAFSSSLQTVAENTTKKIKPSDVNHQTPRTTRPTTPIVSELDRQVKLAVPRSLPNGTELIRDADRSGHGVLKIRNGNALDAVVKLVNANDKEKILHCIYIRENSSVTISSIPKADYRVLFSLGLDWDQPQVKFLRDSSYEEFVDVSPYIKASNTGSLLDSPQGPSEPSQCKDLLFLFVAQNVAHTTGGYQAPGRCQRPGRPFSLAGFEVTIIGRFCPTPEGCQWCANSASRDEIETHTKE